MNVCPQFSPGEIALTEDTAAASGRVGRGRRISQLPAEPPAEARWLGSW